LQLAGGQLLQTQNVESACFFVCRVMPAAADADCRKSMPAAERRSSISVQQFKIAEAEIRLST